MPDSEKILLNCQSCGAVVKGPAALADTQRKCPKCGQVAMFIPQMELVETLPEGHEEHLAAFSNKKVVLKGKRAWFNGVAAVLLVLMVLIFLASELRGCIFVIR